MREIKIPQLNENATKKKVLIAFAIYRSFIKNKNKTKDRIDYINDMNVALQKLVNEEDKKIIQEYMLREKVNRFRVIRELNISEGSYYRIRNKAFYNFAYVFGIAVEKE
ncbi:DUF1492 domain-containing protein [Bacillus cereus]|uniref:DUF1492 domain-containing protein n=1 Tax=Bacillus cereus TaxID=1396 RepID=UPI00113E6833|nr:DUF1492 domain-containing protein [Bacillus cereus]TKH90290.1 DUF1492 domain-containing protein [Bacillus cereus]HDR6633220.1 DUF1492 domain-containing protein [Bacillus cereus]